MAEIGASSYRRFRQEREAVLDRVLTEYSDALVRYVYSIVHNASAAEDIAAESIAIYGISLKNDGPGGYSLPGQSLPQEN